VAKQYECVQVDHHNKIADVIKKYQEKGWSLHTYQAASVTGLMGAVAYYLLFEK
jgi:hypothetical protein